MFGNLRELMKQFQTMQRAMGNEHVKALLGHPKVQAVLLDAEIQALIKAQDLTKVAVHPKFAALMRDPEVASLLSRVNPQQLLNKPPAS